MTYDQALQEAKDRWGKDVRIEKVIRKKSSRRINTGTRPEDIECRVGTTKMQPVCGVVFDVKGTGQTWEEAFKCADRHKPAH